MFIEDGERMFEFLILQPLINTNAMSLTKALMMFVQNVLGMFGEYMDLKLVAFDSDGVSIMMGCQSR